MFQLGNIREVGFYTSLDFLRRTLNDTSRGHNLMRQPNPIIGNSPPMRDIRKLIETIADSTATVMINGESGTGKELVAQALHHQSSRADANFVPLNCAAIPKELMESELFGHRKGAFTGALADRVGRFELAHGGTLFLDEIGDLSLDMQVKLLRVLQERMVDPVGSSRAVEVDVRVIAATHRDLELEISEGRFREDLYYRLNVVHIGLPALRDRKDDLPLLADFFLKKYAARMQKDVHSIAAPAVEQLLAHNWPGNIRELENTFQRALAVATVPVIQSFQLLSAPGQTGVAVHGPAVTFPIGTKLAAAEDRLIRETLAVCGGDKEKAAKLLGVSSRTIHRRAAK